MAKEDNADTTRRIAWATPWARRGGANPVEHVKVPKPVASAIEQFANKILSCRNADEVQTAAFEAIRAGGLKPGDFFPVVYSLLLGSDRGPRLGPYVMDAGREEVSKSLLGLVHR
jgi:lysyl-tRNA synthetase class 1